MSSVVHRPWTDEERETLRRLRAEGATYQEIIAAMQRPYGSIKGYVNGGGYPLGPRAYKQGAVPGPRAEAEPAEPVDPIEAERQRLERIRAAKEERDLLRDVAGEQNLRARLESLVRATAQTFAPPPPYTPFRPKGKITTTNSVVQMFSDWHAGEVVQAEGVRGFNAYDKDVFRERVARIVDAHLMVKRQREAGGGYMHDRLVIAAIGDMVSGTIHELEKGSDHENVVWAVYDCGLVMAEAVRRLAAEYPTVEIIGTSGNHGRLPDARKVQQKEPTRSWDTVVYLFAREHLRQLKNLTWYFPNSYSAAFDVCGWRFLQTHGHDVKSWNSVPWYGLNRLVANINALEAGRGTPVHYWLFAHFHNPSSLPHATGESFINGSLIGGTELSLNALGKSDRPTQWMLFVHPQHGLTTREPLYAEPPLARRDSAA